MACFFRIASEKQPVGGLTLLWLRNLFGVKSYKLFFMCSGMSKSLCYLRKQDNMLTDVRIFVDMGVCVTDVFV